MNTTILPSETPPFTEREEHFLAVHAEFFPRPHDWSPVRAQEAWSTFRPVRDWLRELQRFEVGPFRKACYRVMHSGRAPTVAELRDAYFGVLREARLALQDAKRAAGQPLGHRGCGSCDGRGWLILAYVASRRGRKRIVHHGSPAGGRYYETLVPCQCDLGQQFGAGLGCDLHGQHLARAQELAYSSMTALAELRALCGLEPEIEDGAIDDATVAMVLDDEERF